MAFTIIGWNGVGVINSAESATGWAELGGGTFSVNPDQYLQGANSIGSTYASKSGYTYYTHGSTFDFSSTHAGQKLYIWISVASTSAVDTLANDGLSLAVGDSTANSRHWKIAGSDDDNGWGQGWKLFVIDPTSSGSLDNGTYSLTATDTFGLWIKTIVSVRADTIFIDELAIADGMECHSGSGTFDELITYTWNTKATRVIGVLTENGRFNYALGKLTVGNSSTATANTTLTVTNKVVGFSTSEYWNGTAWVSSVDDTTKLYNIVHLSKHASFTTELVSNNSSWFGNPNGWLTFSKDTGASYTFNGGNLEKIKALTFDSSDSVSNMVINDVEAFTVNGATFSNNTVSVSQPFVISTTISGGVFKAPASTHLISTTNLGLLNGVEFIGDNASHAVDLGTISADVSMDWNCPFSNYASVDGSTGSEVIKVNVNNGITLTINSSSGTPSVFNTGTGTVNVVSGQVTFTLTVKDTLGSPIEGAMVYVWADAGGGLAENTPIINKVLTNASGQVSDTRSLGSNQPILGRVRKSTTSPFYKTTSVVGTIDSNAGLSLTVQMISDE